VQLQAYQERFAALGIDVAAMTYDTPTLNAKFVKQYKIKYPMLSDENGLTAIKFGILNESYAPGHRAYGIPHPGIFFVSPKGVVLAKFAEENYRDRPEFDEILEHITNIVESRSM